MFVLTFSRRQSTGRSLLLFVAANDLIVITARSDYCSTLYTGIQLSGCLVLIAYCDLQRTLWVKYDHVTRNRRRLVQNIEGKPKYWGKVVTGNDESLGLSQLWGTRARCAPN